LPLPSLAEAFLDLLVKSLLKKPITESIKVMENFNLESSLEIIQPNKYLTIIITLQNEYRKFKNWNTWCLWFLQVEM